MAGGAGAMGQRITLQRSVLTPDGAGGNSAAWQNFTQDATPWAEVIAKAGRETMTEGRLAASFTVLFIIYNRADVTEADRILWGGEPYNIRGIRRESGRAARLLIEAERGVQQ